MKILGLSKKKIAELIKVDRTTAARAIKRLEEQGFIYRQEDASNKKIKRIYATEKGKNVYPIIVRENQHSNQVALQGFVRSGNFTIGRVLSPDA